jgi:hypothetical protein
MYKESGLTMAKSFIVIIDSDWQAKKSFRSLDKACAFIDTLPRRTNWQLRDGRGGFHIADRISLLDWFRGEY